VRRLKIDVNTKTKTKTANLWSRSLETKTKTGGRQRRVEGVGLRRCSSSDVNNCPAPALAGQCCLLSDHASSIVIGCVPVHSRMHRDSLVNNSRHLNDTPVCPDTIPRPLYRPVIDPSAFPGAPYSPNRPIRFRCRITQSPDNDTWLTLSYLL